MSDHSLESIYNFLRLSDRIGTAGQPTAAQLPVIKDAGYQVVVSLLPAVREALPDEPELVKSLGMEYLRIPVWWDSPDLSDLEQFFRLMEARQDEKLFIHCAANMRVSAFIYLYRVLKQNMPIEEAVTDLNRIWTPNPIWHAFMNKALAHYTGASRMSNRTGFLHIVYFWLREGAGSDAAEQIVQGCHTYLRNIPSVLRLEVGLPAGTPREVVDNTYGVALLVEFAHQQAHDLYQDHPDHLQFIEEYGPLWSRVQVYDTTLAFFDRL